jgi:hypothetical protein
MRCIKSALVLATVLSVGFTLPVFAQSPGGDNAGGGNTNSMAPDKATSSDKSTQGGAAAGATGTNGNMPASNTAPAAGAMGPDSGTNGNMGTEKGTGNGERPGGDAAKSSSDTMNK